MQVGNETGKTRKRREATTERPTERGGEKGERRKGRGKQRQKARALHFLLRKKGSGGVWGQHYCLLASHETTAGDHKDTKVFASKQLWKVSLHDKEPNLVVKLGRAYRLPSSPRHVAALSLRPLSADPQHQRWPHLKTRERRGHGGAAASIAEITRNSRKIRTRRRSAFSYCCPPFAFAFFSRFHSKSPQPKTTCV